jgi:hypothetical protein
LHQADKSLREIAWDLNVKKNSVLDMMFVDGKRLAISAQNRIEANYLIADATSSSTKLGQVSAQAIRCVPVRWQQMHKAAPRGQYALGPFDE